MTTPTTVTAVYEGGVLRPATPLPLAEGARVAVTVYPPAPTPEEEEVIRRMEVYFTGGTTRYLDTHEAAIVEKLLARIVSAAGGASIGDRADRSPYAVGQAGVRWGCRSQAQGRGSRARSRSLSRCRRSSHLDAPI